MMVHDAFRKAKRGPQAWGRRGRCGWAAPGLEGLHENISKGRPQQLEATWGMARRLDWSVWTRWKMPRRQLLDKIHMYCKPMYGQDQCQFRKYPSECSCLCSWMFWILEHGNVVWPKIWDIQGFLHAPYECFWSRIYQIGFIRHQGLHVPCLWYIVVWSTFKIGFDRILQKWVSTSSFSFPSLIKHPCPSNLHIHQLLSYC